MEQQKSLSKLDEWDMEDFDYPRGIDKDTCKCGRPKQIRSTTCRVCFMESRKSDPRWSGSDAWREERDNER